MRKYYILDTNILLHDPNSITHFADNFVIIPIEVIVEIDRFKHEFSSRGQNAREVSRLLDQLRNGQSLSKGVPLPGGGMLTVHCAPWDRNGSAGASLSQGGMAAALGGFVSDGSAGASPSQPAHFGLRDGGRYGGVSADNEILRTAREVREGHPEARVVIVTKDINLRIRADALGLRAEDYTSDRVGLSDLYTGQIEIVETPAVLERFMAEGSMPLTPGRSIYPNEYVLLRASDGSTSSSLGRVDSKCERIVRIFEPTKSIFGIRPKNKEQYFAFDALLADEIKLVTVMGKAGTGKTLLTVAAGLHQVLNRKAYRGLLVTRPTTPVGRSLGALPGGIEDKLAPWLKPISDTLEALFDAGGSGTARKDLQQMCDDGVVDIQPLSYIRGRSIPKQFLIVDEAQNLTPLEIKTIITRVGHGTKVVLTGDPYQIDNPYVDTASNGFNYLVNKFRAESIAAHVQLSKGERSQLAELAANLL